MAPQVIDILRTTSRPPRRGGKGRAVAFAVFLVLAITGFLLAAQMRTQEGSHSDLYLRGVDELGRMVGALSREIAQLQQEDTELHIRSIDGRSNSQSLEEAAARTQETLEILAQASGTVPVHGSGIQLDIEDGEGRLSVYELTLALNELRAAGAQAISINNRRLVLDSWFGGSTGALTCDGTPLLPPYAFAAIGEPQSLLSALNVPGGLVSTLAQVPGVHAHAGVNVEIEIPPRRDGPRVFEYAKPAE